MSQDGGRKMIRTESGGRVPASFRSGRYDDWRKRNAQPDLNSDDEQAPRGNRKKPGEYLLALQTNVRKYI